MGDHEGFAGQPSGLLPNGLLPNKAANVTRVLDAAQWEGLEERTSELIACIQPNQPSEERRNAVANYVQRLISKCFACQVFTFGSVPLKTYLPDGDIDLTIFSKNESLKDSWAIEVRDMLQNEEKIENAEFHVKEVQYIQAEVKIVKCLVENIVVDISFNQVGGLCTLCFLEEIDRLVDQNHLFKRSIILIKAWCYYESRILGAHHGLISTYALETLVLYIFHVFNNTFVGPLEVLYRFLEFFSNFDWENFCVSLWGPVPICSLPDTTPHPPRKDGCELLLTPLILNATALYAVVQPGQEKHSQPFVSKHFNVIDPLRTNNNLGRSVSKGNFFRIRSAFSFGAKKLARLLLCSKENQIPELNMFFLNTWQRHGSSYRADAPVTCLLPTPYTMFVPEESNNSRITSNTKKKSKNVTMPAGSQSSFPPVVNSVGQSLQGTYWTNNSVAVSRSESHKIYGTQINISASDPFERNSGTGGSDHFVKGQKMLRSDNSSNEPELLSHFCFSRTRSNPDLTDTSGDVFSRARQNRMRTVGHDQVASSILDHDGSRKIFGSEVPGRSSTVSSSDDRTLLRQSSSQNDFEVSGYITNVSDNNHSDAGFSSMEEEHVDDLEIQQDMCQEEQDLVNMMASTHLHDFNEQINFPMHLPPHLHFPLSPVLASFGYEERNRAMVVPTNFPVVEASWAPTPNIQFPQGIVSSSLSHYYLTAGQNLNHEAVESGNETSSIRDMRAKNDDDSTLWHEDDTKPSRSPDLDNGILMHDGENRQQQPSFGGYGRTSSRNSSSNAALTNSQHKFTRENRVIARDEHNDGFQQTNSRTSDIHHLNRSLNSRFSSSFHSSTSRNMSMLDDTSSKISKSGGDKWGRKSPSPAIIAHLYGKPWTGWQFGATADHAYAEDYNPHVDRIPSPGMGNNLVESIPEPASSVVLHSRNLNQSEYELAQSGGSDSMLPMASLHVGGSRQGMIDNPAGVPLFFPTGPPVPFLTMLPVYNFQTNARCSGGSSNQYEGDGAVPDSHVNQSDHNNSSEGSLDQSKALMTSTTTSVDGLVPAEEHKSDILNSDFAIHWKNLQYGRSCQSLRFPGSLIYPSPVVVPPVYLQGYFPVEAPGRPPSSIGNTLSPIVNCGPGLVPVSPLQPGPVRPSSVFRLGETPRFRGGTGTYLPNPKATFGDRPLSSPRYNNRGAYNHERNNDLDDREGSWLQSKPRVSGRTHGGRHQAERPSSRTSDLNMASNRSDRSWDTCRHEPVASQPEAPNNSFDPRNPSQGSANLAYGMYSVPAMGSNGFGHGPGVPSVVMLYPYDQAIGYGSNTDAVEFSSLGPVHIPPINEALPSRGGENPVRGSTEPRLGMFRGGSPRSSPDHPSSPPVRRSSSDGKYHPEDEDFPLLFSNNELSGLQASFKLQT